MERTIALFLTLFLILISTSVFAPLSITNEAKSEPLKGGVVVDEIPKGFFGTWKVTSTMIETNNPQLFNAKSVDIWTLSGFGSTLVLENLYSGASSSIQVQTKNLDGKTLKFTKEKVSRRSGIKIVQKESPEFVLKNNGFEGFDTFIIERWENEKLIKSNRVKYKVVGERLVGDSHY